MSANKPDKAKAIRCLINLHKMPISRFEMLADGKGFKKARARRQVLDLIAGKANSDGTGSFVSDSYLRAGTGFTEKYIWTLRQELKALGLLTWIDKRGYGATRKGEWGSNDYTVSTTEAWPRRHSITKLNPVLEVQDSEKLNPELNGFESRTGEDLNPVPTPEKTALNPVLPELNPVPISTDYRPGVPPLEPTALPTAQTGPDGGSGALAKIGGHEKNDIQEILGCMSEDYAAHDATKPLNIYAGRNELISLVGEQSTARVLEFWPLWLKWHRKVEELGAPLVLFCREFKACTIAVRKLNEDAQAESARKSSKVGKIQRAQDSEINVQKWKDGLAAAVDIDAYIAAEQAPDWIVAGEKESYQLAYADEAISDERERRKKREQKAQEKNMQAATADVF